MVSTDSASKKPCIPCDLPPLKLNWERLAPYTSKAMLELARYDGTLNGILNPAVLLSPITDREAVLSSQIEGTQATLMEVLKHEAGEQYSEAKRGEIQEIINYRQALLIGEKYLAERPITLQLVREMHAKLMRGVRGDDKNPGKFREDQNWIGKKGTKIGEARFIPPAPLIMQECMEKLQAFIGVDYNDPLVQLAIVHAQFEIIHPFSDGNGRVGRMLIPLFLSQKKVLQRPMFYLSEYLEETDQQYRDCLLAITESDDWQGWVEFFLTAIHVQAERNNAKAKKIQALYGEMKPLFRDVTKSQFSQAALDAFFMRPIISSTDFTKISGMKRANSNVILRKLGAKGLITTLRSGTAKTPAVYALPKLLEIAEGRKISMKKE